MARTITALLIITVLLVMIPAGMQAQFRADKNSPSVTERIGLPYSPSNSSLVLGFIDPSKIEMQQSYSMSFYSGGNQSGTLGLYTNRLSYAISPELQLIADIAYLHQPFQTLQNLNGGSGVFRQGEFFYGGELRYRPTENTYFSVRLDNMPRYYWQNNYRHRQFYSPVTGY